MLAQGQQWNLALQDIQLSVEAGYPKGKVKIHKTLDIVNPNTVFNIIFESMSLQILLSSDLAYKLHERRAKCFTGITFSPTSP